MNELGGRSNTGEGGEDPERFRDNRFAISRSHSGAIRRHDRVSRQRRELSYKMAQGAKPGEGGQLPGTKSTSTSG